METIEERLERIERITLLSAKTALNMDDMAAYTGLSKLYLYKLVHLRKIPFYKNPGGKLTYFNKAEVDRWLLAHRVATREEMEAQAAAYALNHPRRGGRRKL